MTTSRMGWQCPRCNTCYSPDVKTCTKCSIGTVIPNTPVTTPMVPSIPSIPFPSYTPPYTLGKASAVVEPAVMWNSGCGGQLLLEKRDEP